MYLRLAFFYSSHFFSFRLVSFLIRPNGRRAAPITIDPELFCLSPNAKFIYILCPVYKVVWGDALRKPPPILFRRRNNIKKKDSRDASFIRDCAEE